MIGFARAVGVGVLESAQAQRLPVSRIPGPPPAPDQALRAPSPHGSATAAARLSVAAPHPLTISRGGVRAGCPPARCGPGVGVPWPPTRGMRRTAQTARQPAPTLAGQDEVLLNRGVFGFTSQSKGSSYGEGGTEIVNHVPAVPPDVAPAARPAASPGRQVTVSDDACLGAAVSPDASPHRLTWRHPSACCTRRKSSAMSLEVSLPNQPGEVNRC